MAASTNVKFDWKTPKPASQVFEEIAAVSRKIVWSAEADEFERIQLKRAQKAYPQLDLSDDANIAYHLGKYRERVAAERQKPRITVKQFFEIAYNWDPFSATKGDDLGKLLTCDRFEHLPLGKLDGLYQYYLMPGMGALPIAGIPPNSTNLGYARAGGGAIAYSDGHPSEADQLITFRSKEDQKLRRLMPLGWLVRAFSERLDNWERTGHALVMDMDEGRQRHPWIVLASSWSDDREGCENETVYAQEEVQAGDPNVHGILPDTTQRTPVGRLLHGRDENRNKPLLLSFGRDFTFGIERLGGRKAGTSSARDTGKGPSLAKIMDWYDDAKKGQLVCYDSSGKEYMRYHKYRKEYRYPNPFDGILDPRKPPPRFIPLEERFEKLWIEDPEDPLGRRVESSVHRGGTGASREDFGRPDRGSSSTVV
ncbi:hypothetical protein MMC09_002008 [Bachmanniomyces sp. S44760]|nr:hypothetical protein [Bachmanniomyces sp. S44760]